MYDGKKFVKGWNFCSNNTHEYLPFSKPIRHRPWIYWPLTDIDQGRTNNKWGNLKTCRWRHRGNQTQPSLRADTTGIYGGLSGDRIEQVRAGPREGRGDSTCERRYRVEMSRRIGEEGMKKRNTCRIEFHSSIETLSKQETWMQDLIA